MPTSRRDTAYITELYMYLYVHTRTRVGVELFTHSENGVVTYRGVRAVRDLPAGFVIQARFRSDVVLSSERCRAYLEHDYNVSLPLPPSIDTDTDTDINTDISASSCSGSDSDRSGTEHDCGRASAGDWSEFTKDPLIAYITAFVLTHLPKVKQMERQRPPSTKGKHSTNKNTHDDYVNTDADRNGKRDNLDLNFDLSLDTLARNPLLGGSTSHDDGSGSDQGDDLDRGAKDRVRIQAYLARMPSLQELVEGLPSILSFSFDQPKYLRVCACDVCGACDV